MGVLVRGNANAHAGIASGGYVFCYDCMLFWFVIAVCCVVAFEFVVIVYDADHCAFCCYMFCVLLVCICFHFLLPSLVLSRGQTLTELIKGRRITVDTSDKSTAFGGINSTAWDSGQIVIP